MANDQSGDKAKSDLGKSLKGSTPEKDKAGSAAPKQGQASKPKK